jgi:Na+(H+)/acetate symporter ActP
MSKTDQIVAAIKVQVPEGLSLPDNAKAELRVVFNSEDRNSPIQIQAWQGDSKDIVIYMAEELAKSLVLGLQQAIALAGQEPASSSDDSSSLPLAGSDTAA